MDKYDRSTSASDGLVCDCADVASSKVLAHINAMLAFEKRRLVLQAGMEFIQNWCISIDTTRIQEILDRKINRLARGE